MSQSRKRRGMKTQALIAERWRDNGMFPHATDAGAGRPGVDILNTLGVRVEVKARGEVSLASQLAKLRDGSDDIRLVVWRHNGQGEASMDDWTVTLTLAEFEEIWRAACAHWTG